MAVTASSVDFAGDALDNVAVTSVTFSCPTSVCSPDSGTATLTGTGSTKRWSQTIEYTDRATMTLWAYGDSGGAAVVIAASS